MDLGGLWLAGGKGVMSVECLKQVSPGVWAGWSVGLTRTLREMQPIQEEPTMDLGGMWPGEMKIVKSLRMIPGMIVELVTPVNVSMNEGVAVGWSVGLARKVE